MNVFINHLQVHVCQSSTVADHCQTFALRDQDNASFRGECDHLHNNTCDRCAFLHSAIAEVDSALAIEMENLTDDKKEELSFKVTQATGNILAWKAHILRSIHQDRARVELLDMLDETSVLLVAVFLGTSASPSGNAMSRLNFSHSATSSNPAHKIVAWCLR